MAVFPDRIVLKNSTDSQAEIEASIGPSGPNAIAQGELVVGLESGGAKLYTLDSGGAVVTISGSGGGTEPVELALGDLTDVDFDLIVPQNDYALVYDSSYQKWLAKPQSGSGGGAVDSVNDQTGVVSLGVVDMNDYMGAALSIIHSSRDIWYDGWPAPFLSHWDIDTSGGNAIFLYPEGGPFDYTTLPVGTQLILAAEGVSQVTANLIDGFDGAGGGILYFSLDINSWPQEWQNLPAGTACVVNIPSLGDPGDGDVLTWDSINQKWTPRAVESGGGGGTAGVTKVVGTSGITVTPASGVGDIVISTDRLSDSPSDGKLYGRQNNSWIEVPTGSAAGIGEAPLDGKVYGRQSSNWVEVITGSGGATSLEELSDVQFGDIEPLATGDLLFYSAFDSAFINVPYNQLFILDDMLDVDTSGKTVNQVLAWDGSNWIPKDAFGVDGASNLDDLGNVNAPSPSDNQVLAYDSTSGEWVAVTVASGGPVSINDLTDVDTSTAPPIGGQALVWNAADSEWVPGTVAADLGDLSITGSTITNTSNAIILDPASGEVVVYGGTSEGAITLNCTANTHGVTIKSPPHSDGATYTLTLPSTAGTAGQVLTSQGGNQLTWETPGGAGTLERITVSGATQSLAASASEEIIITSAGKSGNFIQFTADQPCWVVWYCDQASMTADSSRAEDEDPTPGSGVLAEVISDGIQAIKMTPVAGYFNMDSPAESKLYMKITHKGSSAAVVNYSLDVMPTSTFAISDVDGGVFTSGA